MQMKIEEESKKLGMVEESKRLAMEGESKRLARKEEEESKRMEMQVRVENRRWEVELGRTRIEVEGGKFQQEKGRGQESVEDMLSKCVKFVPAFEEWKVSEFFQLFEKKAEDFGWAQDRWVLLAWSGFKGKALEACNRLPGEEQTDYEVFKSAILRAYELRPEAYSLLFRNAKKRPSETHEQYPKYLSDTLKMWLHSEQESTAEQIKELFLPEQFTNGVDGESSEVIRERRRMVTREAAIWADDHALAKRCSQVRGGSYSQYSRVGDSGVKVETKGTGATGRTIPVTGGMVKT